MIKIILNTPEKVTFEKENREEKWFKDCSNENLLKQCDREGDAVERIQWEDGNHLASLLHVYFTVPDKEQLAQNKVEVKKYRLPGEDKEFPLLDSFVGFVPDGYSNWYDWNNLLGKKKYPCDIVITKEEEKQTIFLKKIIFKEALPMSIYGEERANNWRMFGICTLPEQKDEEFIIPLYPY